MNIVRTGRLSPAAGMWLCLLLPVLTGLNPTGRCMEEGEPQTGPPTRFVADRPVDCTHLRLELDVDVESKHVEGIARLDIRALRETSFIALDAVQLRVKSEQLIRSEESFSVKYVYDESVLELTLDEPLHDGEVASIVVEYAVDDPESGLHFFGPTENEPEVPWVVWSQGESQDNSHWFPCFDVPSEKHTSELVVTTEKGYQVSSNGRLVSRQERGPRVTYHWSLEEPTSTYLITLIVGQFQVTRHEWRGKSIEYWVHPEYADWSERTFRNTMPMLNFFSEFIGVEYPWSRYAQISCEGFGGGMENTTATTIGTRSLRDERSMLDGDADGLIAHELAHQWFGDYTTCRDWSHLWLNEGFASYLEAVWDGHDRGLDKFAYNMRGKASSARRGGTKLPIVDRGYASADSMFDSRAYSKGAWVLHMLRSRLGDKHFRAAIGSFLRDHAHGSVETIDLRRAVEKVTGRSFERFFFDWTERSGHPEVTVKTRWLADEGLVRVDVEQTQKGSAFHWPLIVRMDWDGGTSTETRDITETEATFYFPLVSQPAVVTIDPDQTVLMKLEEDKPRDLWVAELTQGTVIARIRAVEHLAGARNRDNVKLVRERLHHDDFWGVQVVAAESLAEIGGDSARKALLSGLQLEHPRARGACVKALQSFFKDEQVIAAIRPIVIGGDPSYAVEQAAIGAYARLGSLDTVDVMREVLTRESRFETIRNAALSALGHVEGRGAIALLAEWTAADKPRRCRPTAIRALANLTRRNYFDDETTAGIVAVIAATLGDSGDSVRSGAVRALGSLENPSVARFAVPALEAVASNDSSSRIRERAQRTIEAINADKPAEEQLADLRAEFREALEENASLVERLTRLEAALQASDVRSTETVEPLVE